MKADDRIRRSHYPIGDGWTCACGYDFFGGSAAYGNKLYSNHLAAVAQPRWRRWIRLRYLRVRFWFEDRRTL